MSKTQRLAIGIVCALVLLSAGLWNLGGPPMQWDEGWTLSVARNWIEHGFYGRFVDGQPAASGLSAAVPVSGPVAFSFHLFGIGIWQGRLPGIIFMIGALAALFYLASRLYNEPIAIGAVLWLLFLSMHPQYHPLIMGRQVLGELPMMCYLLAGYVGFFLALRHSIWFMALALPFWMLGITAKAQPEPFWIVSLVLPLGVVLIKRQWRMAGLLAFGLVGTLVLAPFFMRLIWLLVPTYEGAILYATPVDGLTQVMAVVLEPFNRIYALQMILFTALPTTFGLGYAAWNAIRHHWRTPTLTDDEIVRLMLLSLAGSWFAWYLLLSVGVPRYLFPTIFVGSIFTSALFYELTSRFSVSATSNHIVSLLTLRKRSWQGVGAFLSMIVIMSTSLITLQTLQRYYLGYTDRSAVQVAHILNTETAPDTLIETYESELHFLLERRYHYPPDQLHVELNRRSLLQQDVVIEYDPLAADPDYLVIGRFSYENGLYEPVVQSGAFRLVQRTGMYEVYERVR